MNMVNREPIHARWLSTDGAREELLQLSWENGGWTADVTVTGNDLQYVMRLDESGALRQFLLFRDAEDADLWLAYDGERWGEVNGTVRDDLRLCTTLALDASPCSRAFATIYLSVAGIDHAHLWVGMIDTERLEITPTLVEYMRTGEREWSVGGTPVEIDSNGLPLDVVPHSRRTV